MKRMILAALCGLMMAGNAGALQVTIDRTLTDENNLVVEIDRARINIPPRELGGFAEASDNYAGHVVRAWYSDPLGEFGFRFFTAWGDSYSYILRGDTYTPDYLGQATIDEAFDLREPLLLGIGERYTITNPGVLVPDSGWTLGMLTGTLILLRVSRRNNSNPVPKLSQKT